MRHPSSLFVFLGIILAAIGCDRVDPAAKRAALPPPVQVGPAVEPAKPAAPPEPTVAESPELHPADQQPVDPPQKKPNEPDELDSKILGPTGRIVGTVTYVGVAIPTPTVVASDKDTECCGEKIKTQDVVISAENRGILNVVVWLDEVKLPDGYKPPEQRLRLTTEKCLFRPRVAAMTVASPIEATNVDTIAHTIQLTGAQEETIRLKNRGEEYTSGARNAGMIVVKCEDHEWMKAFVHVDPHPFHEVTDADGRFAIAGVPVGKYKLKVWHEKFGQQEIAVVVRADEITSLKIQYPRGKTPKPDTTKQAPVKNSTGKK